MPSKNKIGLVGASCYVVGRIIGSGIFITPTGILSRCGSVGFSLVVWVLCGIIAMIGGMTFVELGTSIPVSGADFAYLDYVGWRPVAFLAVFINTLGQIPTAKAAGAATFAVYVFKALPHHEDITGYHRDFLLGAFALLLFCSSTLMNDAVCNKYIGDFLVGINIFRLDRYAVALQALSTAVKLSALFAVVVIGVVWAARGQTSGAFDDAFANTTTDVSETILAIYSGLWSYGGWKESFRSAFFHTLYLLRDGLNSGIEEIENPARLLGWKKMTRDYRTLPIAMLCGLLFVILVYVSVFSSFVGVLGTEAVLANSAVAETFGYSTWPPLGYAMPIIVGISIAGYLNASAFSASRFYYTAARKGYLPSVFGLIHTDFKTPVPALILLVGQWRK